MDDARALALSRALLALRITLGLFLLQWGTEKFVMPQNTTMIWGYFYGLDVPQALGYVFGVAEIAIAACLVLGLFRTIAYGAALVLHAVTVLATWRQLGDPWGDPGQPPVHRRCACARRFPCPLPAAALGSRRPASGTARGVITRGTLTRTAR